MKRIMFYSMTMNSGGAERVIANLANELINDNEVAIATLIKSESYYELNKDIVIFQSSESSKETIIQRIKNSFRLLNNTKKYEPDIIISFCPTMCFISCFFKIFVKKFRNIKLIISERNDPKNEYKNIISRFLANYLYSKSDVIVFQTKGAKSFFSKKVQNKGVIIPNPINNKFLASNIHQKKDNIIINVGRLESQKNHELLIKACKNVFKKNNDWILRIYGEGSLKKHLKFLINDLNMNDKIYLMGRCNNLDKELKKGKIFVLCSNYEGMPNALMEAMACGLACVSTDCPCGGPSELIENNKNGLLVPVNNTKELEKAINKIIVDNELQKKLSNNSKRIIELYNFDVIMKDWKIIIDD